MFRDDYKNNIESKIGLKFNNNNNNIVFVHRGNCKNKINLKINFSIKFFTAFKLSASFQNRNDCCSFFIHYFVSASVLFFRCYRKKRSFRRFPRKNATKRYVLTMTITETFIGIDVVGYFAT